MITKIKSTLENDTEKIREILEEIGCLKIKLIKDNFKFANDDEGSFSGNGNSLNIHSLSYCSYSRNIRGDILTLVAYKRNTELGGAIKWLADFLGLDWEYKEKKPVTLPFNAFFLDFEKVQEENYNYETYDERVVRRYEDCGLSLYWIKDGISATTQEHFRIGYDVYSNRIAIPWFDEIGRCIGVQGRLDREEEEWECKYLPLINFYKSNTLYGLNLAYKDIQNKNQIIIAESEKSVMKAYQMGYTNVVCVGCHSLSLRQIKLIKSLAVNVVLAYDSDIPLEESIKQAKELIISNPFFSNEVYVLDMDGLQEKSCIFDLSKEIVDEAFENRLIYIEDIK